MKKQSVKLKDALFSVAVMAIAFVASYVLERLFQTKAHTTMLFVLGVFLVSLKTEGYFWGAALSVISVFAVNFAFTFPYYAFDFLTPENLASAVVMLIIANSTSALTTKIKEQEKLKNESEREKMRANLLRAISHDLRTPLTSIYGSTSAVIENYDSLKKEQQLKLLDDVKNDAEWLIRMVENLLSVTRIDGKRVNVSTVPTVLEELIDAVLLKFRKTYPDYKVHISIPDEFISICVDSLLIEQVLINLLENAVLHAKGMTELTLSVTLADKHAVFEVADNGCGIPRERMDSLFSGYCENTAVPSDGNRHGMGIGLSVCSAIIKAHGSSIYAENRKTGGASFRFSLETEEAEDEQ